MTKRERRTILLSTLVGLAATAAVTAAYLTGVLDRLELMTLDLRFRYANSIEPAGRIACIGIDDRSLELVGRWPWPRDKQADLIAILAELGAEAILVDLTYVEGQPLRTETQRDADVLANPLDLTAADARAAYPDAELSEAIRNAGNVYLSYHHPRIDLERSERFQRLIDALDSEKTQQAQALAADIEQHYRALQHRGADFGIAEVRRPLDRARIVVLLEQQPELEEPQIVDALFDGDPAQLAFVESAFPRCRETAIRRRLERWFAQDPTRWAAEPLARSRAFYATLTDKLFEYDSGLKHAMAGALREVLSYRATTARGLLPGSRDLPFTSSVDGIAPVYYLHARSARRCGLVNFEPDPDGVMRRERLLVRHRDHILSQLAFTMACDLLGVGPADLEVEPGRIVLEPTQPGEPERIVQLDRHGRTLVPWVRGGDWTRQFTHIKAQAIWSVGDKRRLIESNRRILRTVKPTWLSHPYFGDSGSYAEDVAAARRLRDELDVRHSTPDAKRQGLRNRLDEIEARIAAYEQRAIDRLRRRYDQLLEHPSQAATDDELNIVFGLMETLADIDSINAFNKGMQDDIDKTLARLRRLVEDKVCLIGYTATSLADMTPIPTHRRAPGVMAHANLLNGLLSGQLVHWSSALTNTLIACLLGALSTGISALRRPREAVAFVLILAAGFVSIAGYLAFYYWAYSVALTPSLACLFVTYFAIAIYRFIFVDSERRQLSTALGQYTSKEIARQVAENPELCQRAEMREVTSIFTDLRGFTTISERIGAERTQKLLNACLGCFTDVMLRHEGLVNKFMGDGIFAFWNPVIYPQQDHARRACETAVDLIVALDELKARRRQSDGDPAFDELFLRVGVATGNAIVGPCGSEQKYDYTCIGDSVNLAARLESANKFYGTSLLVGGAARDQAGDSFAYRPLGGVRVKGKTEAVPVYELLGRVDAIDNDALEFAEQFGEAVAAFQKREWKTALERFEACLKRRPQDTAAEVYREATAAYLQSPPPDDWTGAIELQEK